MEEPSDALGAGAPGTSPPRRDLQDGALSYERLAHSSRAWLGRGSWPVVLGGALLVLFASGALAVLLTRLF